MHQRQLARTPPPLDPDDDGLLVKLATAVVQRALVDLESPRFAARAAAFLLASLWRTDNVWRGYILSAQVDPKRARQAIIRHVEGVLAGRVRLPVHARWPARERARVRYLVDEARREEARELHEAEPGHGASVPS